MKAYIVEVTECVNDDRTSWISTIKNSYESALDYIINYKIDLDYIMNDVLCIHEDKYKNLEIVNDKIDKKYGYREIDIRCPAKEKEHLITYVDRNNQKLYYTFYDYYLELCINEKVIED